MNDTATGPWREALGIIDSLLTAEPERREQLLAELANTRPDLHSRVRALLDADAEATRTGFMRVPPRATGASSGATLAAGTRLGPYRIERELGSGGMGEVWLARRDDGLYEGEVAVKTLHPFFAHGVMRERFLREAQLLGRLTHPNIARLLDAGVSGDTVYLVLEYVRGQAIDGWCDAQSLDIEARIRLFAEVCAAVAHAHAHLVIHRDIKPSNILVTDEGRVKLLDFGIGKILDAGDSAERTELTRVTGRIFTPEFAAPEQILGEPVTTATDVYSLGTLLYVLLAGSRPFGAASGVKVEQAVLHEEPRALGAAAREADATVAASRGSNASRLRRSLAGDLEDIVHRALRKAPRERYASVPALADDLARYLRHEPVLARAGSSTYRLNRFVRRHRVAVAASIGVFVAAAVGVAGVLYQAREAREQARLAQLEAVKATSIKDYLLSIFEANSAKHPDGAAARQTTAEQLLDIAAQQVLTDQEKDPEVRLELLAVLSRILIGMDKHAETEALARERVRLAEQRLHPADVRVADSYNDLAEFLRSRGRRDEAFPLLQKAMALRDAQQDRDSWTRGVTEITLGQLEYGRWDGKGEGPIPHYREALRIFGKLPPSHELVRAQLGLARAYEFALRFDESIAANLRGIALAIEIDGPRTLSVAGGNQQLARAYNGKSQYREAEECLRKAVEIFTFLYGPESGFTNGAKLDVGRTMMRMGRHREAITSLEKTLADTIRVDGEDLWAQQTRSALAISALSAGDLARARDAVDRGLRHLGDHPNKRLRATLWRTGGMIATEQNRAAAALPMFDEAMRLHAGTPFEHSIGAALVHVSRAEALAQLGRPADAHAALAMAQPLLATTDSHPEREDTLYAQMAGVGIDLYEKNFAAAREGAQAVLMKVKAAKFRDDLWVLEDLAQRRLAAAEAALSNRAGQCAALAESVRLRSANALPLDPRLGESRRAMSSCP
jgi:serine/threonine protein kinase